MLWTAGSAVLRGMACIPVLCRLRRGKSAGFDVLPEEVGVP